MFDASIQKFVNCKSELEYTNDDDGIWIVCNIHNWCQNIGFGPSVYTVVTTWEEHVRGQIV